MSHGEGSELSLRWAFFKTQRASGWGKAIRVIEDSGESPTAAKRTGHGAEEALPASRLPEEAEARNRVQRQKNGGREKEGPRS